MEKEKEEKKDLKRQREVAAKGKEDQETPEDVCVIRYIEQEKRGMEHGSHRYSWCLIGRYKTNDREKAEIAVLYKLTSE